MIVQQGPYSDALDVEDQLDAEELVAAAIFYGINDDASFPEDIARNAFKSLCLRFGIDPVEPLSSPLPRKSKLITMFEWRIIRTTTFCDEQEDVGVSIISHEEEANAAGKDILRYFLSAYRKDLFANPQGESA